MLIICIYYLFSTNYRSKQNNKANLNQNNQKREQNIKNNEDFLQYETFMHINKLRNVPLII